MYFCGECYGRIPIAPQGKVLEEKRRPVRQQQRSPQASTAGSRTEGKLEQQSLSPTPCMDDIFEAAAKRFDKQQKSAKDQARAKAEAKANAALAAKKAQWEAEAARRREEEAKRQEEEQAKRDEDLERNRSRIRRNAAARTVASCRGQGHRAQGG